MFIINKIATHMKYIIFMILLMNTGQVKASEFKNIDKIIDNLYQTKEDEILNQIFISKTTLKNTLIELNNLNKLNLSQISTIEELNEKMQKNLLRKPGVERRDLQNTKFNFNMQKIFVQKNDVKDISSDKKWLIAGSTYDGMNKVFKKIISNKNYKNNNYIILVSDRPVTLEDFNEDRVNQIYKTLTIKTPEFSKHKNEIIKIIKESLNDKSFPALKRMILYTNLVGLIKPEWKKEGNMTVANLKESIKVNGLKSDKTQESIVECRKFIYTKATTLLPTEKDLANMLIKKYDIKKIEVISTKNKYQTQDRATTMDTYHDFFKYIGANNIPPESLILVNTEPYTYRQWFQLISLCKAEKLCNHNNYPDFLALKREKISDSIFKDEFARLIYSITKESY